MGMWSLSNGLFRDSRLFLLRCSEVSEAALPFRQLTSCLEKVSSDIVVATEVQVPSVPLKDSLCGKSLLRMSSRTLGSAAARVDRNVLA